MTDEEKSIMEEWTVTQEEAEAEMYANEKHCSKCINFGDCVETAIEDRCKVYRESYTDYLDGLTKGRKENEILKNIISTILDKDNICYICQMKGQVLPECMRMENSECLKNMISLWSK